MKSTHFSSEICIKKKKKKKKKKSLFKSPELKRKRNHKVYVLIPPSKALKGEGRFPRVAFQLGPVDLVYNGKHPSLD